MQKSKGFFQARTFVFCATGFCLQKYAVDRRQLGEEHLSEGLCFVDRFLMRYAYNLQTYEKPRFIYFRTVLLCGYVFRIILEQFQASFKYAASYERKTSVLRTLIALFWVIGFDDR